MNSTTEFSIEQSLDISFLTYAAGASAFALLLIAMLKKGVVKKHSQQFIDGLPYRLYGKKIPVTEVSEETSQEELLSSYRAF